jgi:hypothetical protein
VINMTDAIIDGEGPGEAEDDEGGLPGFGLVAGLGALAMAAVAGRSRLE